MVQIKGLRFFIATAFLGACLTASRGTERDQKPVAPDMIRIPVPTTIKPVDINSGSIEQLRALPGIHSRYAQKIIDGHPYQKKKNSSREKLFPSRVLKN
jgi:hypothetical protein